MSWSGIFEYKDGDIFWKLASGKRVTIGDKAGCYNGEYLNTQYKRKLTPNQVIIWEMHNGPVPEGLFVDHINRIKDDNKISNLRLVTRSQNQMNHNPRKGSSHGFKGIVYRPRSKCWMVTLLIAKGKNASYGHYATAAEAAQAYNVLAPKVYGEYAVLNKLPEGYNVTF